MMYRGFVLDAFQATAIHHLEAGRSVLVSAPTGTGKTVVADWIVDDALSKGKKVVYTAPIKALSNQKFRDYTRLHGEANVGLVTGDLVIRRDAPCRVMTTEILRNMLLGDDPDVKDLAAVVLDEIHFLDDRERGTVWEEVLIYLPPEVQIVGLSATLSNLDDLAAWLTYVRGTKVEVVFEPKRAVPLDFYLASIDAGAVKPVEFEQVWKKKKGRIQAEFKPKGRQGRGPPGRGGGGRPTFRTRHVDLFKLARTHELLPALYFVFSRRDAESYARELARYVRDSLLDETAQAAVDERIKRAAAEIGPALDPDVRGLLSRGIAFHHAGLHVQLKALVEELYEQKLVRMLYCTSTFALGLNMPARTVMFDALEKFDGQKVAPLTTRGFMQKAGRAGRRGLDDVGHVLVRMDLEDWERFKPLIEQYQKSAYEPVRSSFNLSWNSVVNLLERHDDAKIRALVRKSFLAWTLSRQSEHDLKEAEALERNADGQREQEASRTLKTAKQLRKRAGRGADVVWDEFRRKVDYLRDIGYLDNEEGFNAGARILRHLQIAELPMTELVLGGTLESLDPATMFGVFCALTNELPRAAERNVVLKRDDKEVIRAVEAVVFSSLVTGAAEITGSPWTFDADLIPIGRAWAEGKPLQDVLMMVRCPTDISGDLVTGFRRAKDLAGQLRLVYAEMPERAEMFRELVRKVSRDEVEVVD